MHSSRFLLAIALYTLPQWGWSQADEVYREGDKVQAQDCAHGCLWREGTVRKTNGILMVIFDSDMLPDGTKLDPLWNSVSMSDKKRVRRVAAAGAAGVLSVGDKVDDKGPRPSHARGVVIEAKAPSYRVRYDGCGDTFNAWRDAAELAPAASLGADHPDAQFFVGKWSMFIAGAPTTVRKGNDLYREYSTGAKAPPLEVRADGTYSWIENFNQAPVKGRWTPSARIADAGIGAEKYNGIVLNDRAGNPWKLYRRNADQMEMRLVCSGQTQMGTRIR